MLSTTASLAKDRRSARCEMQHRHFACIADILRELPTESLGLSADDCERINAFFADELARTNPRFDRARFLTACRD